MIALDASAAIEWLLRGDLAGVIDDRLAAGGSLHAPHLLSIEVAQAVRRLAANRTIDDARGVEALQALADLDGASVVSPI